jgi:hypothetical protein
MLIIFSAKQTRDIYEDALFPIVSSNSHRIDILLVSCTELLSQQNQLLFEEGCNFS